MPSQSKRKKKERSFLASVNQSQVEDDGEPSQSRSKKKECSFLASVNQSQVEDDGKVPTKTADQPRIESAALVSTQFKLSGTSSNDNVINTSGSSDVTPRKERKKRKRDVSRLSMLKSNHQSAPAAKSEVVELETTIEKIRQSTMSSLQKGNLVSYFASQKKVIDQGQSVQGNQCKPNKLAFNDDSDLDFDPKIARKSDEEAKRKRMERHKQMNKETTKEKEERLEHEATRKRSEREEQRNVETIEEREEIRR